MSFPNEKLHQKTGKEMEFPELNLSCAGQKVAWTGAREAPDSEDTQPAYPALKGRDQVHLLSFRE